MAENEKSAEAEVREKLAHLQELKVKLDASDAEISQLHLPAVETALSSLRLGVPISLKMGERENGVSTSLSFEKVGKAWRLCVVTELQDGDIFRSESTPLSDVPRDDRATIFELFVPSILDAAVDSMKTRLERRKKSIGAARGLVETVSKINAEKVAHEAIISQGNSSSGSQVHAEIAKAVHEKSFAEKSVAEKSFAEKSVAEKAIHVKALRAKAVHEKAVAEKSFTESGVVENLMHNPLYKAVLALSEATGKAAMVAAKPKLQKGK